jgi:hypothetical protein
MDDKDDFPVSSTDELTVDRAGDRTRNSENSSRLIRHCPPPTSTAGERMRVKRKTPDGFPELKKTSAS